MARKSEHMAGVEPENEAGSSLGLEIRIAQAAENGRKDRAARSLAVIIARRIQRTLREKPLSQIHSEDEARRDRSFAFPNPCSSEFRISILPGDEIAKDCAQVYEGPTGSAQKRLADALLGLNLAEMGPTPAVRMNSSSSAYVLYIRTPGSHAAETYWRDAKRCLQERGEAMARLASEVLVLRVQKRNAECTHDHKRVSTNDPHEFPLEGVKLPSFWRSSAFQGAFRDGVATRLLPMGVRLAEIRLSEWMTKQDLMPTVAITFLASIVYLCLPFIPMTIWGIKNAIDNKRKGGIAFVRAIVKTDETVDRGR